MKHSSRIMLVFAICTFVLGGILFSIGMGLGGFPHAKGYAAEHGISFEDGISINWAESSINFGGGPEFNSDFEIYKGNKNIEFSKEETTQITKLNMELGGANLYIHESTNDYISCEIETKLKSQCFIDSSKLYVKLKSGDVNLYLPKGFTFDAIDMDLGAAKANIDFLNSKSMDLDFGASDVTIKSLTADNADLDLGAGDFAISNGNICNAKVSVGAGNFTYNGDFTENLELECGMGNAELYLSSKETDHSYDISCGMGNVDYGSFSYSGIAKEAKSETVMKSHFKIECGMGNTTVQFEK